MASIAFVYLFPKVYLDIHSLIISTLCRFKQLYMPHLHYHLTTYFRHVSIYHKMSAISLWFLYKQYNRKHDESNRQWIKEIMYKFVILMYISPLHQARNEFKTIFCWLSTLQDSRQVLQARLKKKKHVLLFPNGIAGRKS